MALAIDFNQNILHNCSKQAFTRQIAQGGLQVQLTKAASLSDNPKIPDPSLFNFSVDSGCVQEEARRLPSVAECATHLELLQAFRYIRAQILSSKELDDAFGIKPENRTVFRKKRVHHGSSSSWVREPVKLRDDTFEKRREEKWPLYLRLAASRFFHWITAVEAEFSQQNAPDRPLPLPPIDVLMVWHALLLNPKWFRSFEQMKLEYLSKVAFPWEQIFLTKEHKSLLLRNELVKYGANRDEGTQDRFDGEILPEPSTADQKPDFTELRFLDSCRAAASNNDVIEKLVDAVKRQSTFVDKMDRQLWIRSPAVEGTLTRGITRYERFLKLFKLYPRTMLVPTLDIDLVWHTHQCSPSQYILVTTEIAGRFIDHNDKLGTATLDPAFENTKALYRIRFADEYRICNCWDCEALRSAIRSRDYYIQTDVASVAFQAQLKVAHYRAVEIARQKGEKFLPICKENT
ncbi:hypothetical protein FHL15_000384 [Xylaria flabelliformis]|uniref:Glycine-rich domain-containing protein 1 n=1 Tax=Xylaria flabelliformis TaxID=2512241 RepID=A0A553IFR6_9PEZI|nr:hypothetical protein FHL15_000384 [Xylaria flabelliformis]